MSNSQFREELIFQIRKQVLLQNPQELKGAPDDSFLRSIDVRIDDRRLGEFRSFCSERMPMETQIKGGESATSPSQPVFLTFHGTSNPSALNSIVEHGFLMPGQQHPRYGYSLNMRVGNLYGDGVYSSSKLHIAASYAAMADDSTVQLIVSIVAPGRVHYVGHAPFHGLPPYPHSSGSKCAWTRRDGMLTPGCESGTYPYAEDANTLTPDFSTMWICGDSRQMCPVAVVTLLQLPFQSVESWTSRQMLHAKETAALSQPQSARFDIQLTHLCEDFYAFPDSIFREVTKNPVFRRSYVIPKSALFDKSFVSAFSHFTKKSAAAMDHHNGSGAQGPVHLYGTLDSVAVPWRAFESTYANHMKREKRYELVHGLRAALEDIIATPHAATAYNILVIVVDQTTFSQKDLDELVEVYQNLPKRFYINVKIVFSPVFVDSVSCRKESVLAVKYHFQAEGIFERHSIDAGETKWPATLDLIEDELQNIGMHNSAETYLGNFSCEGVNIQVGSQFYGEGLFVGIDKTPVWSGVFHHRVLFKGLPPRTMLIDGSQYNVSIRRIGLAIPARATDESDKSKTVASSLPRYWKYNRCPIPLEKNDIIGESSTSARPAAILSHVACLLALLASFRNGIVHDKEKVVVYRGAVERIAAGILSLARDCPALQESPAAATLAQATASIVGEIQMLSAVKFSGDLYDAFQRMRFGKKLVGRIAAEENSNRLPLEMTDVTAGRALAHWNDQLGIPVRVKISDASAIEPWNVIVEYVTTIPSRVPVNVVYRAALVDERLEDCFGQQVTDVILDMTDNSSDGTEEQQIEQHQHAAGRSGRSPSHALNLTNQQKALIYYAFVQTRNPLLSLRQQGIALQTVAWIKAVESLLLRARLLAATPVAERRNNDAALLHTTGSVAPPKDVVLLAIDLMERTLPYFSKWIPADAPLSYFVNWSVVLQCKSIAQLFGVLGAAAAISRRQQTSSPSLVPIRLKFDVLAETLVRLTRSFANSTRQNEQQLLQWLFGVQKDEIESDDPLRPLDVTRALRRTQKILRVSATNCSPFAAVAAFGFLDLWGSSQQQQPPAENIAAAFSSRTISMPNFFQAVCAGETKHWTPPITQLALFVWAIQTHRSGLNRPRFTDTCADPHTFVKREFEGVVETLRGEFRRRVANVAGAAQRNSRRSKARQDEADVFREYHQVPQIFSRTDVENLERNRERVAPSDIPFTLLSNGLLAHHCCYPDCPQYLQPIVTEADIADLAKGKLRRNGMRRHLEPNKLIGNYIPNFHAVGRKLAARSGESFETFVGLMDQHFHSIQEFTTIPRSLLQRHLQAVWDSRSLKL